MWVYSIPSHIEGMLLGNENIKKFIFYIFPSLLDFSSNKDAFVFSFFFLLFLPLASLLQIKISFCSPSLSSCSSQSQEPSYTIPNPNLKPPFTSSLIQLLLFFLFQFYHLINLAFLSHFDSFKLNSLIRVATIIL